MDLLKIADIIYNIAISEDHELSKIAGEGIFYMPELAFVYQCGKSILREADFVFGNQQTKWIREENLGNGSPTDLIFDLENGEKLVIEFKLRGTATAYEKDIIKLCRLEDRNVTKLFCALIDVFDSKLPDDGRQKHIETLPDYRVKAILKASFGTKQNWYHAKTSCVVCVWSVSSQAAYESHN